MGFHDKYFVESFLQSRGDESGGESVQDAHGLLRVVQCFVIKPALQPGPAFLKGCVEKDGIYLNLCRVVPLRLVLQCDLKPCRSLSRIDIGPINDDVLALL